MNQLLYVGICKKIKTSHRELNVANRLNHFSHFFLSSTSPNCTYFACCREIHLFFLPSFLHSVVTSIRGAAVHHCPFCWQSLQGKLRAPAFPTASGSGNLHATNCWRCGRVFWESFTALSYFTFSTQHPVWLLAETRYGASCLSCWACSIVHQTSQRLLVYLILHRVVNKGGDRPGHQHIQGYVFMKKDRHAFCLSPETMAVEGLKKGTTAAQMKSGWGTDRWITKPWGKQKSNHARYLLHVWCTFEDIQTTEPFLCEVRWMMASVFP